MNDTTPPQAGFVLMVLASDIADACVRSEVELYAHELKDDAGHPMFDTRRPAYQADDLKRVNQALQYIELRGDVFPWVLKRRLDSPTIVQFFDKENGDGR
ncbi:MAG: hypothetical protein ACREPD_04780 [Stenotrophomonas sp.]|uniref:hypothetical protein n=1 Tax=Stenotrophomonas sp. TaxID=69392 RepID=UPI003D6CA517